MLEEIAENCQSNPDTANSCRYLGEDAARAIVREENICKKRRGAPSDSSDSLDEFRKSCLRVATNVCEGFIQSAAYEPSCDAGGLTLDEQEDLASKCEEKVRAWTSD